MTWFVRVYSAAATNQSGSKPADDAPTAVAAADAPTTAVAADDAPTAVAATDAPTTTAAADTPLSGPIGLDFRSGALESALHWQVIWPRAIAMAWSDEEFRDRLIANPQGVIEETFGYRLSDNLDLTIKQATSGTFDRTELTPGVDDPWSGLPKLKLTLAIPPAPSERLQAVAITAYQDTGRTYPFTCC